MDFFVFESIQIVIPEFIFYKNGNIRFKDGNKFSGIIGSVNRKIINKFSKSIIFSYFETGRGIEGENYFSSGNILFY